MGIGLEPDRESLGVSNPNGSQNGKDMSTVNLAIAGIGNCASSLVQGLHYYAEADATDTPIPGLMHPTMGPYHVSDIDVVAAFDIDERKVGRPVSEAIFAEPNCTTVFQEHIPETSVSVQMGPVLDGVADHLEAYSPERRIVVADEEPVDLVATLEAAEADVLANFLPVGSQAATERYAAAALEAGCGFVNCIPVFIASEEDWADRFHTAGLPVVGDDIKAQLGATITHRGLSKMFADRGVAIDHTYQLNTGGNTDFLNMLERDRLDSKKRSKTEAVQSQLPERLAPEDIHVGPSDYVPWLHDNKVGFIRLEGRNFGDVPLDIELRLSVEDSPNSAGVAIDAIRGAKIAIDRGIAGPVEPISAYFMKHPPVEYPDPVAAERVEAFIENSTDRH